MSGPAAAVLARHAAGIISAEVALMQLLLALGSLAALERSLAAIGDAPATRSNAELLGVAAAHRADLARAAGLVESGLARERAGIAAIRDQFDRAVALSPEAAVALYSLGSPETLARATEEIVGRLEEWGLLRKDSVVLDFGCGIGRLGAALSPYVRWTTGIDLSPAMVEAARHRCDASYIRNADFIVGDGQGLGALGERRFNLVLAIDSFPYVLAAGAELVERHIAAMSQRLLPDGALVIVNYSYRGDLNADRNDIAGVAARHGLAVERNGTRDFALWDGVAFLLRKNSGISAPSRPE